VSITGDNQMPSVQFIRLTTAIAVICLGVIIEQMNDASARRFIFAMIITLGCMKLYFEIETYIEPTMREDYVQKRVNKLSAALLLAIHKVLYIIQIIVLSKWFSRNWFPFFISLWFMSAHLSKFLQDQFRCDHLDSSTAQDLIEKRLCMKTQSWYGILSCIGTFIIALFMLYMYSIDPLDKNLIINEQATYLSTNLKDVKKIMSKDNFLDEIDEIFEKEQNIRRGTYKT
jgi:hypothetical protein